MHLSGEELVVVNIAIGAGLTYGASAVTQRRARREAKTTRRQEAYAAFILTLDHLQRTWDHPETLEDEHSSQKMGDITAQAVREIQRTYVPVLLVGSKKAKQEAHKVREAAWAFSDYLNGGSRDDPLKSKLGKLFGEFTDASRSFIELAEAESSR